MNQRIVLAVLMLVIVAAAWGLTLLFAEAIATIGP